MAVYSQNSVQDDLREFAVDLLSETGGMVEWQDDQSQGSALVPIEVGQCLGQNSESFVLSNEAGGAGLSVSLGGQFLDLAVRTLEHFVPMRGAFAMPELNIKKSDFQQIVDAAFGWQNARARVKQGIVGHTTYHTWWLNVVLHSEDTWETVIAVSVNSSSLLPTELGSVLDSMDLQSSKTPIVHEPETLHVAGMIAQRQTIKLARSFFDRADQRLNRDRKRLKDYYAAMQREATTTNRRTKVVPSDEEIQDRKRVVGLELKRKLVELDDRFAVEASIKPLALAQVEIPTVVIEVEIQRKSAMRVYRLYWNALRKSLEPLKCSRCAEGSFNFWFTNDTVDAVCNSCHSSKPAE